VCREISGGKPGGGGGGGGSDSEADADARMLPALVYVLVQVRAAWRPLEQCGPGDRVGPHAETPLEHPCLWHLCRDPLSIRAWPAGSRELRASRLTGCCVRVALMAERLPVHPLEPSCRQESARRVWIAHA
jgi:hypothetical protein